MQVQDPWRHSLLSPIITTDRLYCKKPTIGKCIAVLVIFQTELTSFPDYLSDITQPTITVDSFPKIPELNEISFMQDVTARESNKIWRCSLQTSNDSKIVHGDIHLLTIWRWHTTSLRQRSEIAISDSERANKYITDNNRLLLRT